MLQIRSLILSDVPFAMQLVEIAGWNQLPGDWHRLLRIAPDGCFLAQWRDRPAGTATAIAYGADCAWVGMVLVHPDSRRQGIGGALISHCLNYLKSLGVRTIKLDATDEGKAVYLKQGFVDEYGTARYLGQLDPRQVRQDRYNLQVVEAGDWQVIAGLDRKAFGADRSELLSALAESEPALALVAREGGRVAGYGFARPGRLYGYIGPIVAERMEAAQALLVELSQRLAGKTVLVDTTALNPAWSAWLENSGLQLHRRLTRMYSGTNDSPGDTSLVYTLSAFETG